MKDGTDVEILISGKMNRWVASYGMLVSSIIFIFLRYQTGDGPEFTFYLSRFFKITPEKF